MSNIKQLSNSSSIPSVNQQLVNERIIKMHENCWIQHVQTAAADVRAY